MFSQSIIYKIADFFQNPIEFRNPFGITPFELKAGSQILGANSIGFDSTETELGGFEHLYNRYMNSLELDLMKYNLVGLLLPQNFIDLQTGLGFKYSFPIINQGLPNNWPQNIPGSTEQLYFSPRIIEGNISQSLAFQWSKRFYNYVQINAGRAFISAYKTREGKRYLNQDGWTFSVAVGMKMLSKIGFQFKEGYGVEIKYNFAKFDDFSDPYNISPINNLDFSSIGIYLTFNMISGGNPTQGDEAKALFKSSDYIAAKANFEDFISKNPTHPRQFKAGWMIDECNNLMAFQQVELARHFIEAKNYSKAAQYLEQAAKSEYPSLVEDIENNYRKIQEWLVINLDSLLLINQIDQAERLLTVARSLNIPNSQDLTDQYWSEIYFHRGAVFTEYKNWDKALNFFDMAVKKYPPIRERVDPWLLKIAYGYIRDVNLSVDQQNVELALESLRKATELRPEIIFITKDHIQTLEQGIDYLKQQAAKEKLQIAVDQTRKIPVARSFIPKVGMTDQQLLQELGKPVYEKTLDSKGNQHFELWIYHTDDSEEIYFYFKNGILSKIERL
ncbi:MAG: tetratricopeptide repeat protein [Candidatus Marinimicrobia bacterium]|nr:tetratricopeptide repeat protein [Candidatus Neomarinimicrobiota bacterium]